MISFLLCLLCATLPITSWQIRRVENDSAENWIPAKVPSTVAVAYRDAGLLEDIRYDDNLTRIDDDWYVADFEYKTVFSKPSFSDDERVVLNLDGISWKADVTLNGLEVGTIEGSFIRSHFDITDLLKDSNELKVYIHRQANPGAVKIPMLNKHVLNGGIMGADNPSFHASIGWDWLPTVPGRNIGIWNDVYITVVQQGLVIEDVFFDTVLDKKYYPGAELADPEYAVIRPVITINNFSGRTLEKTIDVKFGEVKHTQKVVVAPGRNDIALESFKVDKPRLWWPNGYGEPYLYDVKVQMGNACKEARCGIRQMFYTLESNALQMYINGRRFIPKGGNWGFSDINLEFPMRNYKIALKLHQLMNFNMIRNWVGQIGDEELYEACDEAGIMVWQDFWLANPCDGPDPDNEAMFIRNANDMVHKVRNHACIALFCARNEGIPTRSLELHLNRLVSELCPHSLFIANSSEFCVSGQGPYHNQAPVEYFRNRSMYVNDIPVGDNKFHSERGAPCIPSYESMCRIFRPEHRWPQNDVWAMHNFTLQGAQKGAVLNDLLKQCFGSEPTSLQEFSDRAQYLNYNTYRAMFESRSNFRNGLLLWMSHPAWPCLVFQTYDYYFDVNAATYACKKACAPVKIIWNPLLSCIEVVNDSYGDIQGLDACVAFYDVNGKELSKKTYSLDSRDDSTTRVCDFDAPAGIDFFYLKLNLSKDGRAIADNFYWDGKPSGVWTAIPKSGPKDIRSDFRVANDKVYATVTNVSSAVIPMIRVNLLSRKSKKDEFRQVLPSFYEDNYFALFPGESRTIEIEYICSEYPGETLYVNARALR